METNNTPSKEEILKSHLKMHTDYYKLVLVTPKYPTSGHYILFEDAIVALDKYSDSQNKALIEERDSWEREAKNYYEFKIEAEKRATELTGIAEQALRERDKYKEMCGKLAKSINIWKHTDGNRFSTELGLLNALTKYNNLIKE